MFAIRETKETGLGWFATRDIAPNTTILDEALCFRASTSLLLRKDDLAEQQLLSLLDAQLTAAQRKDFDALFGASPIEKAYCNGFPLVDTARDRFGLAAQRDTTGIFLQSARLNHSCRPNAARGLEGMPLCALLGAEGRARSE
eukprot:g18141.t1